MNAYRARKLMEGGPEVESFIDDCSQVGVDVIELMWKKIQHNSSTQVIGIDVPKIQSVENPSNPSLIDYKINWIDGAMTFYNDNMGRCWAYIADTKENRKFLARSFVRGDFRIVDQNIRNEMMKIAIKEEYPTDMSNLPDSDILDGHHVKKSEEQKKIAELEAKIAQLTGTDTVTVPVVLKDSEKPLKRIKISKSIREEKQGKKTNYAN